MPKTDIRALLRAGLDTAKASLHHCNRPVVLSTTEATALRMYVDSLEEVLFFLRIAMGDPDDFDSPWAIAGSYQPDTYMDVEDSVRQLDKFLNPEGE